MGRPTSYTPEKLEAIARRLKTGEPLVQICRDPDMPDDDTVRAWGEREDVGEHVSRVIARAREVGYDAIAADALTIADTPEEGTVEKYEFVEVGNPDDPDGQPVKELQLVERKVGDMLEHRKLRIHTRLQLLAKWDPKRYGNRQTIEHDAVGNLADELKAARERAERR